MQIFPVKDTRFKNLISRMCDLKHGPWVAGGSVRKVFEDLPWHKQDIDFFFNNPSQFNSLKDRIVDFGYVDPYVHETANAITYTIHRVAPTEIVDIGEYNITDNKDTFKVQLIRKKWHNSAYDLISDFDFGICQFVTDGNIILASDQAVQDSTDRLLRTVSAHARPVNPNRVIKYCAYGYSPLPDLFLSSVRKIVSDGIEDDTY